MMYYVYNSKYECTMIFFNGHGSSSVERQCSLLCIIIPYAELYTLQQNMHRLYFFTWPPIFIFSFFEDFMYKFGTQTVLVKFMTRSMSSVFETRHWIEFVDLKSNLALLCNKSHNFWTSVSTWKISQNWTDVGTRHNGWRC